MLDAEGAEGGTTFTFYNRQGFTPARGLLLADRYRLSALCTSIIMELRYNDESLTAFYDSDEHAVGMPYFESISA